MKEKDTSDYYLSNPVTRRKAHKIEIKYIEMEREREKSGLPADITLEKMRQDYFEKLGMSREEEEKGSKRDILSVVDSRDEVYRPKSEIEDREVGVNVL